MDDLLNIPHFETEREEADWWFENRGKVELAFERAEQQGRLRRGSKAIVEALKRSGEAVLTVRLSETDLSAIHRLAEVNGQDDETCAAALLHEVLAERKDP